MSDLPVPSRREVIAYHEAGHAAVGDDQGLTFGAIHLGDAGGRVLFDPQWSPAAVLGDADLLDRYALMLMAGGHAEQRRFGRAVGAGADVDTLDAMLAAAGARGTAPRADPGRRAERRVAARWAAIAALAGELIHASTPVADLAGVLARDPDLGSAVDELPGPRARAVLRAGRVSTAGGGR